MAESIEIEGRRYIARNHVVVEYADTHKVFLAAFEHEELACAFVEEWLAVEPSADLRIEQRRAWVESGLDSGLVSNEEEDA